MGQTITDSDGSVSLSYSLKSAPWVGVGRINIWRNGLLAKTTAIDENRNYASAPLKETVELPLAQDAQGASIDTWFVVEAIGYRSMFPVIRPLEVPPVVLTDAVASLAGPLGLANDAQGALRPPEVFPVTAYAITNPVWVTTQGSTFRPPGVVPIEVQSRPENDPKFQAGIRARSTVSTQRRIVRPHDAFVHRHGPAGHAVPLFYPRVENPLDVRKALSRMGHMRGHSH
jgi:hypothetical protein